MTKSARRKDSEQRSLELDLKMEVMLLKEQLMELQEDYDDLKNDFIRTLTELEASMYPEAQSYAFNLLFAKLKELDPK